MVKTLAVGSNHYLSHLGIVLICYTIILENSVCKFLKLCDVQFTELNRIKSKTSSSILMKCANRKTLIKMDNTYGISEVLNSDKYMSYYI